MESSIGIRGRCASGCIVTHSAPGAGACFEFSLESVAADCRLAAPAVRS
jgi:hypothetical protein